MYRIYYKVQWHDRELENSYMLVKANNDKEARKKLKIRIKIFYPKMQITVYTSLKNFIK